MPLNKILDNAKGIAQDPFEFIKRSAQILGNVTIRRVLSEGSGRCVRQKHADITPVYK